MEGKTSFWWLDLTDPDPVIYDRSTTLNRTDVDCSNRCIAALFICVLCSLYVVHYDPAFCTSVAEWSVRTGEETDRILGEFGWYRPTTRCGQPSQMHRCLNAARSVHPSTAVITYMYIAIAEQRGSHIGLRPLVMCQYRNIVLYVRHFDRFFFTLFIHYLRQGGYFCFCLFFYGQDN